MADFYGVKLSGTTYDSVDKEARDSVRQKADEADLNSVRADLSADIIALQSAIEEKANASDVSNSINAINLLITSLQEMVSSGLDQEQINAIASEVVSTWLDGHPEATTSIEDGAISASKIASGLLPFATPQMFGYTGEDIDADTAAIQSALDNAYTVFFPVGTYNINATLYQNSNGGERCIIGANRMQSKIVMDSSITNAPVLYLGNQNGHGNYRGCVKDIHIDGGNHENGNIGILWEEAGTSHTRDVCVSNCEIGIKCVGCTHFFLDGNNYIMHCDYGVKFINSSHGNVANCSVVKGCWFTGCYKQAIYMQSCEMAEISNNTLQSVGAEGNTEHLIELFMGSTGAQVGLGAVVYRNWIEGGYYKYAIYIHDMNNARIESNFIAGSSAGSLDLHMKEGGILLGKNVKRTTVSKNTIIQYFNREVADGRESNASIYVTNNIRDNGSTVISSNNIPTNQCPTYVESTAEEIYPTIPKCVTCTYDSEEGAVVKTGETYGVFGTVVRRSQGVYYVPFTYNRPYDTQCFVTPCHTDPLTAVVASNSTGAALVKFYDENGNLKDPTSFFVMTFGN